MTKPMAPFSVYPARVCENPDCKTGPNNTRANFVPTTPWQLCCSTSCRMRLAYLKRKAKKKSEESGS
jgi:hypothetical protein